MADSAPGTPRNPFADARPGLDGGSSGASTPTASVVSPLFGKLGSQKFASAARHVVGTVNRMANVMKMQQTKLISRCKAALQKAPDERTDKDVQDLLAFCAQVNTVSKLSQQQQVRLCQAMTVEEFNEGQDVITAGDFGDKFYIIMEGACDAIILKPADLVSTTPDTPRASATPPAATPRMAALKTTKTGRIAISKTGSVRHGMTQEEKKRMMNDGKCVICGEAGHFASACPKMTPSGLGGDEDDEQPAMVELKVGHMGAKMGFGELALMTNAPRAATVRATEPTICMVVGREDYQSILGGGMNKMMEQKLKLLNAAPAFRHLSKKAVLSMSFSWHRHIRGKGSVLCAAGEPSTYVYLLLSGECRVFSSVDGGEGEEWVEAGGLHKKRTKKPFSVCTLGPNAFVGEQAGLVEERGGGRHKYTVQVTSPDCEVFAISTEDFKQQVPAAALKILAEQAEARSAFVDERAEAAARQIKEMSASMRHVPETPRGGVVGARGKAGGHFRAPPTAGGMGGGLTPHAPGTAPARARRGRGVASSGAAGVVASPRTPRQGELGGTSGNEGRISFDEAAFSPRTASGGGMGGSGPLGTPRTPRGGRYGRYSGGVVAVSPEAGADEEYRVEELTEALREMAISPTTAKLSFFFGGGPLGLDAGGGHAGDPGFHDIEHNLSRHRLHRLATERGRGLPHFKPAKALHASEPRRGGYGMGGPQAFRGPGGGVTINGRRGAEGGGEATPREPVSLLQHVLYSKPEAKTPRVAFLVKKDADLTGPGGAVNDARDIYARKMRLDAFLKLPSVKHLVEGDERSRNPMPNHYAAEVNKLVGKKPGAEDL